MLKTLTTTAAVILLASSFAFAGQAPIGSAVRRLSSAAGAHRGGNRPDVRNRSRPGMDFRPGVEPPAPPARTKRLS